MYALIVLSFLALGGGGALPSVAAAASPHAPVGASSAATTSSIDALVASRWIPKGQGYDWSRAGYAGGERPIPSLTSARVFNVKRLGAKGDGVTLDDRPVQTALRRALASPGGGVVYFPRGSYRLSKPLYANASNIVLRGAGRDSTRLLFTKSLSQVYGAQWGVDKCTGLPTALWAAGGAFVVFSGSKKVLYQEVTKVVTRTTLLPGTTRLPVASTRGIRAGQWLTLILDDASTAPQDAAECENVNEVYNRTRPPPAGGSAAMLVRPLPPWVTGDPLVQDALQQMEAGEPGGISLARAAALDAEFAAANGANAGAANAARGSIAAWVYGNNVVDSGGPGAINPGAVRMSFRVKLVRRGFIVIDRDIIYPIKPSWKAVLALYSPGIQESGIERLTISFPKSGRFQGHFTDRGYNAVQFISVANCWARDLRTFNADNALVLTRADFTTLSGITIDSVDRTIDDGMSMNGHNGIGVANNGQGVLVSDFRLGRRYYHDMGLGNSQKLSVFRRGTGADMNMEQHRAGPMANLMSDIVLGRCTRPFKSGGRRDRGANTGRGATFWNVRCDGGKAVTLPPCGFGPNLNFVLARWSGKQCPASRWQVLRWQPPMPADLFKAQKDLRSSEEQRRAG